MEHLGVAGPDLEEPAAELVGLSQAPGRALAVGDREEIREGNGGVSHGRQRYRATPRVVQRIISNCEGG